MLRLVASQGLIVVPKSVRIGLVGLDEDLTHYLEQHLRVHWACIDIVPVARVSDIVCSEADLVVCTAEPTGDPQRPTLWLSDPERSSCPFRVRGKLWKCAMPITGATLVRVVKQILQSSA